ncbi:hypothetical protein CL689_05565 [Candidatus Saccharibacteria bacterium]|nr:hypothetical protein [Candidatus Saccharibacteria bacterium]MBJ58322.1 hypothetical protein [Candidatus Saccharibacteria bacterium]MBQ69511.1 hypothetical protein [Candidatus Saccharibacteria bacterium]|tara:strand:+ start:464 stop:1360 length:897 start_codon:yes stop_codon:yes gene_type:complete
MIEVFVGENTFGIKEAVAERVADFGGEVERYDGETLTPERLADLLGGGFLFADRRCVIIRDLSKNAVLWGQLPTWLDRIADTTQVLLIEEKLDKRTAGYKALKQAGALREFPAWGERDRQPAINWVLTRAKLLGVGLNTNLARHLVDRVGLDQWQLSAALEKLSLVDQVNEATIDEYIDAHPSESVFRVFELAIRGDRTQLQKTLDTLEMTEDAYALFALLSAQAVQLLAVTSAPAASDPAKDFGIHPFVVTKMRQLAKSSAAINPGRIVERFAVTDRQLKSSAADPWLLIRKTLIAL